MRLVYEKRSRGEWEETAVRWGVKGHERCMAGRKSTNEKGHEKCLRG